MPTLGAHFSDEEAKAVELAAAASPEKRVSPYVAEAIRKRMASEGMLPGNPRAEVNAVIDEVGLESALAILRKAARAQKRQTAAA
jgi:hypothetical protein